ncbi:MAG: hypothetical protein EZS28_015988, partial [Streblomastix strix]
MVAASAMVYKLNESIKQVPYPWTIKPMHNQGTKHGKPKKLFTTWKDSSVFQGPEVEKGRMFLTQILDRLGPSRGAQQLSVNSLRFKGQRHYLYAMRTITQFSYEYGLSIDQLLSIIHGFLLLEGPMISHLSSQEVTGKSMLLIQSRNKE